MWPVFHHLEPITIKNTCGIMHIFSDIGHNMHNLAVSFLNFKQFTIFDIDPWCNSGKSKQTLVSLFISKLYLWCVDHALHLITASDSHLQQRTLSCTCEKRRWLINYEILFNEAPGLNNCIIFLVTFYPLFQLSLYPHDQF